MIGIFFIFDMSDGHSTSLLENLKQFSDLSVYIILPEFSGVGNLIIISGSGVNEYVNKKPTKSEIKKYKGSILSIKNINIIKDLNYTYNQLLYIDIKPLLIIFKIQYKIHHHHL